MKKLINAAILLSMTFLLANCGGLKHCSNSYDENYKGSFKVGNQYEVNGEIHTPSIDQYYNKVGIASWYGDDFHCNKTANGEKFNKTEFSAAHKTLPLPSVVRVTNLSNNKTIKVVVNDRGPFVKHRIIDLSESAADSLGMKHHGVAKVRVEFLPHETNELLKKLPLKTKILYHASKDKKRIHAIKVTKKKKKGRA